MDPLHRDPGTPIIRGQGAVEGLHLLEVIRGSSSREDHTLQLRVGVVVLTPGDFGMCSASSKISLASLHGVLPHLLVEVAFSSLLHLLLVEDLAGVQDVSHVDSMDTLQFTAHSVPHSIQDRDLQHQSLQWETLGDHTESSQQ